MNYVKLNLASFMLIALIFFTTAKLQSSESEDEGPKSQSHLLDYICKNGNKKFDTVIKIDQNGKFPQVSAQIHIDEEIINASLKIKYANWELERSDSPLLLDIDSLDLEKKKKY